MRDEHNKSQYWAVTKTPLLCSAVRIRQAVRQIPVLYRTVRQSGARGNWGMTDGSAEDRTLCYVDKQWLVDRDKWSIVCCNWSFGSVSQCHNRRVVHSSCFGCSQKYRRIRTADFWSKKAIPISIVVKEIFLQWYSMYNASQSLFERFVIICLLRNKSPIAHCYYRQWQGLGQTNNNRQWDN